ncbi:atp-binding cassette sub-family b [Holotrichia oblita]|nr:atp-binding cassette sub-family b [Holotrichia oblita]
MSHGEVLSRVTNDVDTIEQSFRQTLAQLVTSVTTVLGVLIMMLSISPLMTAVAVLILPMSLIVVMFIVKKSQKYFKQQQEYLGHINGQVEEVYGGLSIVKAFNAEEQYLHEFNKYNDVLYSSAWKSQMMSGIMMPAMNFIGNIGYVVVSILGSYLAIKKVIQVGDILSFLQYVRNLTNPIAQTAQVANALQSTIAAAERVFEFLNEEEEIPETQTPAAITNINGNVSFDHVRFGYKSDKIVIKDFSADIKQGQKIAIVGPTGAGKTTIVKLLMRFYELNSGSILVDGINIKDFKREDLRNLFGMVLQDTWLFNGTIMENIRYGNMNATDEEVKKAADSAYADHFIRALPNSYQMVLNEEASNISQGQKQLLTIARAILANPKILILDEATSSVDTRTEVLIQKAMAKLMKGRTNFIIAHRLSTIRDADMILVMNEGDIVEQGSHTELLQRNGFYAKLYNSQFDAGEEAS